MKTKLYEVFDRNGNVVKVSVPERDEDRARKDRKNAARRARHEALTSLGLKRVKGALGGVYYE